MFNSTTNRAQGRMMFTYWTWYLFTSITKFHKRNN